MDEKLQNLRDEMCVQYLKLVKTLGVYMISVTKVFAVQYIRHHLTEK